jgi:hypothetical protein
MLSSPSKRIKRDSGSLHLRGQGNLIGYLRVSTPNKESLPQQGIQSCAFSVARKATEPTIALNTGRLHYKFSVTSVGRMDIRRMHVHNPDCLVPNINPKEEI